jgi:hypothetical protein
MAKAGLVHGVPQVAVAAENDTGEAKVLKLNLLQSQFQLPRKLLSSMLTTKKNGFRKSIILCAYMPS